MRGRIGSRKGRSGRKSFLGEFCGLGVRPSGLFFAKAHSHKEVSLGELSGLGVRPSDRLFTFIQLLISFCFFPGDAADSV
jgi:hypothetical protein